MVYYSNHGIIDHKIIFLNIYCIFCDFIYKYIILLTLNVLKKENIMSHCILKRTFNSIQCKPVEYQEFFVKSLRAAKYLQDQGFTVEPFKKGNTSGWIVLVRFEGKKSKLSIRRELERTHHIIVSSI